MYLSSRKGVTKSIFVASDLQNRDETIVIAETTAQKIDFLDVREQQRK